MPGFARKFIRVAVQPKVEISEAGPAVYAISTAPIAESEIPSGVVSMNFRNLVTDPDESYVRGLWTILGPWTVAAEEELVNGYGVRSGNGPASLLYQEDIERGDMQLDIVMTPDKTAGLALPPKPVRAIFTLMSTSNTTRARRMATLYGSGEPPCLRRNACFSSTKS
jgi:hypothetical protein